MSALWLLGAIGPPLLIAGLALVSGWRGHLLRALPLTPLPALVLALAGPESLSLSLPWLLTGLEWGLEPLRRPLLLLAAVVWLLAGGHASRYLRGDPARGRFVLFWCLSQAGNLLWLLGLDVVSFYTGFAVMTFAAYGLVVHQRGPEAFRAGRVYLTLAVIGEGLILAGLLKAVSVADSLMLSALPPAIAEAGQGTWLVALLWAGFGVKAGVALLHLWLPLAHPVAPTPASAVLSGVMIKAGLAGWLLTLPFGYLESGVWGATFILWGLLASLGGALLGVTQTRAKVVLAYSSISQMGLITVGGGTVLLQPELADRMLPLLVLFALHHGLAKSALFLSVGSLQRRAPWLLWLAVLWPALVLIGLPLTSGALVKVAIKHEVSYLADPFWLQWLPWLLTAGAVATALLMGRFVSCLRRETTRAAVDPGQRLWWLAAVVTSATAALWLPPGPVSVGWQHAGELLLPLPLAGILLGLLWRWPLRPVPPGDVVVPLGILLRTVAQAWHRFAARVRRRLQMLNQFSGRLRYRLVGLEQRLQHLEILLRQESALVFVVVLSGFAALLLLL